MKKENIALLIGSVMAAISAAGYFIRNGFTEGSITSIIVFVCVTSVFLILVIRQQKLHIVQKDELTELISLKSMRNSLVSIYALLSMFSLIHNFFSFSIDSEPLVTYTFLISLITFFISRIIYNKRLSAE